LYDTNLNKIFECEARTNIVLGNGNNKADVAADHLIFAAHAMFQPPPQRALVNMCCRSPHSKAWVLFILFSQLFLNCFKSQKFLYVNEFVDGDLFSLGTFDCEVAVYGSVMVVHNTCTSISLF
jgi:hypothetical protein